MKCRLFRQMYAVPETYQIPINITRHFRKEIFYVLWRYRITWHLDYAHFGAFFRLKSKAKPFSIGIVQASIIFKVPHTKEHFYESNLADL